MIDRLEHDVVLNAQLLHQIASGNEKEYLPAERLSIFSGGLCLSSRPSERGLGPIRRCAPQGRLREDICEPRPS
jgi:hypothetical protein